MDQDLPCYRLYAIKYAERAARRAEHFIGGDTRDEALNMDYVVWVAVSDTRTLLIDTGFSAATAARRKRAVLRCPIASLALIGLAPGDVTEVLTTHLHYDHAGNTDLLPGATFHLQESELRFVVGPDMRYRYFSLGYEIEDVLAMVRLNFAGRLTLHDGPYALGPGLEVGVAPGHSVGLQYLRIHTARGWVTLAGDVVSFFDNLRRHRPFVAAVDVSAMLRAYDAVRATVPSLDFLIPGHDPEVMRAYPPAAPDLAGIVARLDLPPRTPIPDGRR
ncbi:N-acyl homoserine lactonase family protein [Aquabacter spiritensis]|uniref:Glyoxylase-like metal-dependent hydrolase (Beta-lactamase superfamily II) n=1 Tax=Aquabacter spiritensis TaxID=933073 RepID=A0A4R3LUZ2_9HYPH|nr:N-acyl homoserine lactonase family protein [Aquabacter spiritensis]TCT04361.1 glyoxylase-like metal-dependent hydrolase (beta-lactamase superfamily II) [Aquabacter spiritensis]